MRIPGPIARSPRAPLMTRPGRGRGIDRDGCTRTLIASVALETRAEAGLISARDRKANAENAEDAEDAENAEGSTATASTGISAQRSLRRTSIESSFRQWIWMYTGTGQRRRISSRGVGGLSFLVFVNCFHPVNCTGSALMSRQ